MYKFYDVKIDVLVEQTFGDGHPMDPDTRTYTVQKTVDGSITVVAESEERAREQVAALSLTGALGFDHPDCEIIDWWVTDISCFGESEDGETPGILPDDIEIYF